MAALDLSTARGDPTRPADFARPEEASAGRRASLRGLSAVRHPEGRGEVGLRSRRASASALRRGRARAPPVRPLVVAAARSVGSRSTTITLACAARGRRRPPRPAKSAVVMPFCSGVVPATIAVRRVRPRSKVASSGT